MAKSDVTQEQARGVIDKVAQELGLLVGETSGFIKVQGPSNKHRVYVQRSQTLNRIDTTLPIPDDDPAHKPLSAPNGSISCHVQPNLEQLERALRMLADTTMATQVPNKPRPFAATKAPPARKPKPVAEPVADSDLAPEPPGGSLKSRLALIHQQARSARIRRFVENDGMSEAEAIAVVDGKARLSEVKEALSNQENAELTETLRETGIEAYS